MFTKLTLPCIMVFLIIVLSTQPIYANFDISKDSTPVATPAKKWYDQISLRGYVQVRYNRLLETNSKLKSISVIDRGAMVAAFFYAVCV
jgi:hypothetical protein